MDVGTKVLRNYIQEKGISVLKVSKGTGISYGKLQRSLLSADRALRADELLAICQFLEVDPMRFYIPPDGNSTPKTA